MESYISSHDEYDDDEYEYDDDDEYDVPSGGSSLQLSFGYILDHSGRSVPTEKRR